MTEQATELRYAVRFRVVFKYFGQLAHDTRGTTEEARRSWAALDRPQGSRRAVCWRAPEGYAPVKRFR